MDTGWKIFDVIVALSPLLVGLMLLALWRGLVQLRVVTSDPGAEEAPLALIRAIRGLVVALGLVALVAGAATRSMGWVTFGLVFLAEEIYETGVALLLLRWGVRRMSLPGDCDTVRSER